MSHIVELTKALNVLFDTQDSARLLIPFVRDCRMRGGTLFLAGNGGSFATALHWACDLTKVCAIRAHVLGANGAMLTAWANDGSYADALADELNRMVRNEDALICLSCSGTSPNIAAALAVVNKRVPVAPRSTRTALVTGIVNSETAPADLTIRVQSRDYAVIEDCHLAIGHWLVKELAHHREAPG